MLKTKTFTSEEKEHSVRRLLFHRCICDRRNQFRNHFSRGNCNRWFLCGCIIGGKIFCPWWQCTGDDCVRRIASRRKRISENRRAFHTRYSCCKAIARYYCSNLPFVGESNYKAVFIRLVSVRNNLWKEGKIWKIQEYVKSYKKRYNFYFGNLIKTTKSP